MIIMIHFYNLTEMLVSMGIVRSMRRQLLFFLFFSTMSGLLAAMVVSVWRVMFHRMVTQYFAVAAVGSYSYHHSFTSIPKSLQIVQCMCAAAFLWRCMCTVLNSSGKPVNRWPMVPSKQPHSLHFGSTSVFMRMLDWYQRVGRL